MNEIGSATQAILLIMPQYVMIGWDGPDGAMRRDQNRRLHLDHIRTLERDGRIIFAGPIRSDSGDGSVGAVIVLEAANLEEARALVKRDPYVTGGVFESFTVNPFKQVIPEPK
jgi:hypothetical protein